MQSLEAKIKEQFFSIFHIPQFYTPANTIPCQRNETINSGSGMRMWKESNLARI